MNMKAVDVPGATEPVVTDEPIDPTTIPAAGPDEVPDIVLTQPIYTNQPKHPEVDLCEGFNWLNRKLVWFIHGLDCKGI
jgi:hypothetical protein